jgi:hypothetical protein
VRDEEVLQRGKEKMNIIQKITRRKAKWICYMLHRNCILKHVIERKIKGRVEVKGRRGRRSNWLLEDLKETRGYRKLQEETLDRTLQSTRFGRFYGTVVRQTTE